MGFIVALKSVCVGGGGVGQYIISALRYHTASVRQVKLFSFYLAIRTNDYNSSYLDFAMEANAKGWLAVGFAPQPVMVCMPAPRLYVPVRVSLPLYSPMLTSLPVW